jgi:YHS domain-containing protein
MSTTTQSHTTPATRFQYLNWVATDPLPRAQTQSDHLHEPGHRINTIDPMTGKDIENVTTHPSLEDGDVTLYFENEETRKEYLNMPIDHPNQELPFPPSDEDDRGG